MSNTPVRAASSSGALDAGVALDASSCAADAGDDVDDAEDDAEADSDDGAPEELEPRTAPDGGELPGGPLYSADISDEELARRFKEDPASLGSMSVGFADSGRIITAVQVPPNPMWSVVSPDQAWGVQETVDFLGVAIGAVNTLFPGSPAIRVNHISKQNGGYLRPHQSHQSGRDSDLAFYYLRDIGPGYQGDRIKVMDLPRNWALIKSLATLTDVQVILVDKKIQKALFDHALSHGEDKGWLDGLFHAGGKALVKHARHHKDHFHVRFFAPRSQELGRRIQPLLALRPDQNLTFHKVKNGDTLGHIAARYGSTVGLIMKVNGMKKTFLRLGQVLQIPLRGPCTRCPLPPPVLLPPRRLPPALPDAGPTKTEPAGPNRASMPPE